jgi:RNA polymerase sigma factor (sigma-70 family)
MAAIRDTPLTQRDTWQDPHVGQASGRSALDHDAGLLDACRLGDARAWREVVARYERLVFSIPLRYGLSRDDAADVCQSTFTALLEQLDAVRDGTRLGAWLATVARRHAWRLLERTRLESGVEPGAEHDPVEPIADAERLLWVTDALLALSEACRDLLLALYFDASEPSYAEVAQRLDRPVGSIGPTRARCLRRLREELGDL